MNKAAGQKSSLFQKHEQTLLRAFAAKQRKNSRYSLRAFAKDLELHPSTLSAVLKGKRAIPGRDLTRIAQKLALPPRERAQLFAQSNLDINVAEIGPVISTEALAYEIIVHWEYFAILTLMDCRDFKSNIDWMASRLGLSKHRVAACVNILEEANLIEKSGDGKLVRKTFFLKTTEDTQSAALRAANLEALQLATEKLGQTAIELRDFSTLTFKMPVGKINDAKKLIRRFRKEMEALLESEDSDAVYQLGIQLYPLTQEIPKQSKVNKELS